MLCSCIDGRVLGRLLDSENYSCVLNYPQRMAVTALVSFTLFRVICMHYRNDSCHETTLFCITIYNLYISSPQSIILNNFYTTYEATRYLESIFSRYFIFFFFEHDFLILLFV